MPRFSSISSTQPQAQREPEVKPYCMGDDGTRETVALDADRGHGHDAHVPNKIPASVNPTTPAPAPTVEASASSTGLLASQHEEVSGCCRATVLPDGKADRRPRRLALDGKVDDAVGPNLLNGFWHN